ncbi:natural cytotoxicity triggering receptor 1-like isoform X1 [Manis javanica]|uniref:natural cytotoxicity triggering receptor 1-like isoform X1 n=1 Tax=Manis javanica TaxID=9974 RepID=UPI003C6CF076
MRIMSFPGALWSEVEGRAATLIKSPMVTGASFSPHILCLLVAVCRRLLHGRTCARICAMPSALAALLCLGLYLSQRISGQTQTVWKPVIWAQPNFMVPKGRPVTIWCRGPRGAVEYQLYFEGRLVALERQKPPGVMSKVKFSLSAMTPLTAGQYSCLYRSGERWSEPSDPLDLAVTEMYDTPTLSVHPGPQVVSGGNVTFYCRLETATSTFFLLKEGQPGRPQRRHGSGQAAFLLGPVSTAHRGTYRCFGSYNNHAWSFPSEPVRLLVTGDAGDSSLAPTELTSSDSGDPPSLTTEAGFQQDLALWNHTAQNLLRIGLAFLVLMALGGLLAEDWLCRKRAREEANTAASREGRRRFRTRRLLNE